MRKSLAALALGVLLAFGAPNTAEAQQQDGLVNVVVGDVTIAEDVNVAVAADIVAQICGVEVGPVAIGILGRAVAVDRSGRSQTICEADTGDVTIEQN